MNKDWTAEETKLVQELRQQGKSASEMMKELPGRTRDAILGKIDRLKKKDGGAALFLRKVKPGVKVVTPPRKRIRNRSKPVLPPPKPKPQRPAAMPDDAGPVGDLVDLKEDRCHWPFNDPRHRQLVAGVIDRSRFFWCGEVTAPGLNYCPMHMEQAFRGDKHDQQSQRNSSAKSVRGLEFVATLGILRRLSPAAVAELVRHFLCDRSGAACLEQP
jgi:hypothetical protein